MRYCTTLFGIYHPVPELICMRHVSEILINMIFPTACISCNAAGPDICNPCISGLLFPKKQNYEWITSLGNYHDPILKEIMWHIKKQPNNRASQILAESFGAMILNRPKDPDSWIFIPIPISKKRFRERGYNQSELLIKHFTQVFNIKAHSVLVKTRHTNKQGTAESKEERAQNIVGSFGVYKKSQALIAGKNCILVDDITTTGSTLIEARETLLRAGASRVIAWTIAN